MISLLRIISRGAIIIKHSDVIVFDIDYTTIYSRGNLPRISLENDPYLNPVLSGRESELRLFVTGRPVSEKWHTLELLNNFGIFPAQVGFNSVENFDQKHIAEEKTYLLEQMGATYYVEDNAKYREVMREYWGGECISSIKWVMM